MKKTPLHQQPSSRIEQRVPLHTHVRARVVAAASQIPSVVNPSAGNPSTARSGAGPRAHLLPGHALGPIQQRLNVSLLELLRVLGGRLWRPLTAAAACRKPAPHPWWSPRGGEQDAQERQVLAARPGGRSQEGRGDARTRTPRWRSGSWARGHRWGLFELLPILSSRFCLVPCRACAGGLPREIGGGTERFSCVPGWWRMSCKTRRTWSGQGNSRRSWSSG
jgi:hypothetical protein